MTFGTLLLISEEAIFFNYSLDSFFQHKNPNKMRNLCFSICYGSRNNNSLRSTFKKPSLENLFSDSVVFTKLLRKKTVESLAKDEQGM